MLNKAKMKNPLQMFQQAAIQRQLEDGLAKKMRRAKERAEAEERANVYGFQRQLLQSPTSVSMLNCVALKKTDPQRFDQLYQQMKKRKATSIS